MEYPTLTALSRNLPSKIKQPTNHTNLCLHHWQTIPAVCVIHKSCDRFSLKHIPSLQSPMPREIQILGTMEQDHLWVPTKSHTIDTNLTPHTSDMETCHCSFTIVEFKSWNLLPHTAIRRTAVQKGSAPPPSQVQLEMGTE